MATTHASPTVIGVDLGGTKILAGRFDASDQIVARERIEVAGLSSDELVEALAGVVLRLAAASPEPVVAAGFGVPTTIDQRTGVAVNAAHLPIRDLPLRDLLAERTGMDVFLDNDGNVAALAEQRLGVGAGVAEDLLMLTLGTGVGGGIITGGRIMRGAIGAGAEIGHMSIAYDGLDCVAGGCNNRGCIETYASGSALRREVAGFAAAHPQTPLGLAVAGGEKPRGELVSRFAREGDADALRLLEQLGEWLGVALVSLVNIFNPRMIAVGGGLSSSLDLILPVARRVLVERALPPGNTFVEVVPASFGADAGMVGAALMARDGLLQAQSRAV